MFSQTLLVGLSSVLGAFPALQQLDLSPTTLDAVGAGNASDDLKRLIGDPGSFFASRRPGSVEGPIFAESIQKRLKCTEISINRKAEEERKLEARYVVETEVTEGMRTFGMGASLRITPGD